jgi:hypothetical protein
MQDMALALQRCLLEVKHLSSRLDAPSVLVPPPGISSSASDTPNILRATLTAKPSTVRTTPSRSSNRNSNDKQRGKDDPPLPNGHFDLSRDHGGGGGGDKPPQDPDDPDDYDQHKTKKKKKKNKKNKKSKKDKKERKTHDDDDDFYPFYGSW